MPGPSTPIRTFLLTLRCHRWRVRAHFRRGGVPDQGLPVPHRRLARRSGDGAKWNDGWYVTLRLTAGMYHRFHAPHDLFVERVRYISGDTWNVNPIALRRIERLFCKNERAPITVRLEASQDTIMLVPVAAVLVASIRLPFLDPDRGVRIGGERTTPCEASFARVTRWAGSSTDQRLSCWHRRVGDPHPPLARVNTSSRARGCSVWTRLKRTSHLA